MVIAFALDMVTLVGFVLERGMLFEVEDVAFALDMVVLAVEQTVVVASVTAD